MTKLSYTTASEMLRYMQRNPGWLNPPSIDEKTVAERKWRAGLRPAKPQVACDLGLFSDEKDQLDLIEMFQEPTND